MMGLSSHSSMSSMFDTKESALPYSQCAGQIHPSSFPCTDHRGTDPSRWCLPGFQSLANGQHWQEIKEWEEARSQGISPFLSASWGVCAAAASPDSVYSCPHHLRSWRAAFHNLPESGASLPLCKSTYSPTEVRKTIAEIRMLITETGIPIAHLVSQLLSIESTCPRLFSKGVTASESQASICLAFFLNLLLEKQDFS